MTAMRILGTTGIGMITGNQIKAARALLDWTQDDLASTAGVTSRTVRSLEADAHRPFDQTFSKLRSALEKAGITFLESDAGVGVMLAMQPQPRS